MIAAQCISRDALKEYVSGWSDAESSEAIESHLTQCEACEQTVADIERDPESLLEFVRRSRELPGDSNAFGRSTRFRFGLRARPSQEESGDRERPAAAWHPAVKDFGPYELLRPLGGLRHWLRFISRGTSNWGNRLPLAVARAAVSKRSLRGSISTRDSHSWATESSSDRQCDRRW